MDIWTERLKQRHLPLLEPWVGRASGRMTANDFPREAGKLCQWLEKNITDPDRIDCLVLVYETAVGIAGLRKCYESENTAELYLLLGETNYNPLRTATYATLRMLDRAFLSCGYERVDARVTGGHKEYMEALERMGFSRTEEKNDMIYVSVEKKSFLDRKYLF